MMKSYFEWLMESDTKGLIDLVNDSKDLESFLSSIITDHDMRYKNRKLAKSLIKYVPIDHIKNMKPDQSTDESTINLWIDIIKSGNLSPIIIRTNNQIDGHHKLSAYDKLNFNEVPVIYESDLIKFYNDNKKD